MIVGKVDFDAVERVLSALSGAGLRRVEAETGDGRKVTGYYITDKQIRVDIVEPPVK